MSYRHNVVRPRRPWMVALVAASALLLGACGADNGATSSTSNGGTSGAALPASLPSLTELGKGTEQSPPTSGPLAKPGVAVAFVSCGQVSPGCSEPPAGLAEAAKELGWTTSTLDGKFNVGGGYATALHQAISQKPGAIAMAGIDCAQIKQPLEEAKAAGIPVFSMLGSDCDASGGEKLFAAEPIYRTGVTTAAQWYEQWGRQKAQYLIRKLNGHVRLINVRFNDTLPSLNEGVTKELATCSDCTIVADVAVGTADAANPQGPIVPGVKSALLQHPDANALLVPFDTQLVTTGLLQAVKNSSAGRKLVVTGGEGSPTGIEALKVGPPPTAIVGYSAEWMGWALADTINRHLNGAALAPEGFGTRVVEQDHAPSGDRYEPAVDFKAAYRKAWGIG